MSEEAPKKIGLLDSARAGAAVEIAERKAAKDAAKDAKQTLKADAGKIADAARTAVKENHALVQQAVETGGKELTGLRGAMFKFGNTRIGGLLVRNPKKSIALGIAVLGGLTYVLRSNKKELPPQAELTPIEAIAPMDVGPAQGRGATEWRDKFRPGAGQQQGLQQPTPSVAENAQPIGTTR